ncbi:MAG: shikimate dehydrogenase [Candidatus Thorarchaeota archaeon]
MKLLVVVGHPLGHSMSPVMHNASLAAMDLKHEYRYEARPLLKDELPALVESIRTGALEGANITIPYKTEVMTHLTTISEEGLAVGSVNTLYRNDDGVTGCNTDIEGFDEALREQDVDPRGLSATILGAGGAAKAVAFALAEAGVRRLDILNRTQVKAEELATAIERGRNIEIRVGALPTSKHELQESDLLVNCTPVGMRDHSINGTPLRGSLLRKELVVMDLVYNPLRTRFLKEAEEAGCKTIDGSGMLVHQGAASLELWTGREPPIEIMRGAVLEALGGRHE